jgi:hypothetical protein
MLSSKKRKNNVIFFVKELLIHQSQMGDLAPTSTVPISDLHHTTLQKGYS